MKRTPLILAVMFLFAVPLSAADRSVDLTGWAAWVDPNSSGTFNSTLPNQPFDVRFDGELGYGLGANIFFGDKVSASFDAVSVSPQASYRTRSVVVGPVVSSSADTRMVPITAVLQWHFNPGGVVDPYIGAGAAYVLFDDADEVSDVGSLGVRRIDFKDDAGLALNAGLSIGLGRNFAIVLDGKYVPVSSSATAVYATGPETEAEVKVNPVIFSAGLSLRF